MNDISNTLITMADIGMSDEEVISRLVTCQDLSDDSNLPSVGRDIEVLTDHVHQKYFWA